MSKCLYCDLEKSDHVSCAVTHYQAPAYTDSDDIQHFGATYARVAFGDERRPDPSTHCSGCGVSIGQMHHVGCDMEECPKCGNQAISCSCDLPTCLQMDSTKE